MSKFPNMAYIGLCIFPRVFGKIVNYCACTRHCKKVRKSRRSVTSTNSPELWLVLLHSKYITQIHFLIILLLIKYFIEDMRHTFLSKIIAICPKGLNWIMKGVDSQEIGSNHNSDFLVHEYGFLNTRNAIFLVYLITILLN